MKDETRLTERTIVVSDPRIVNERSVREEIYRSRCTHLSTLFRRESLLCTISILDINLEHNVHISIHNRNSPLSQKIIYSEFGNVIMPYE